MEPLALEKGIALIQEPQDTTYDKEYIISNELMLTGSDILIYRMLYNLVENAIKYNHVNGKVIVSAKQTGNDIVITIADTGSGLMKHSVRKFLNHSSGLTNQEAVKLVA